MGNLLIKNHSKNARGSLELTGSKSISNRVLILKKLYFNDLNLSNLSDSEDTELMKNALNGNKTLIDVNHAGTAMRFLTAYFSVQEKREVVLTGSERMKQRPISILVNALRELGADIEYLENEGFPPLKIKGKRLNHNNLSIDANVSSQYISALMLIAPSLENGLEIKLRGKITSKPYIKMTVDLMNSFGLQVSFLNNFIKIQNTNRLNIHSFEIESDWSSASYFYSILAIANKGVIKLKSFKENSTQGDSELSKIFQEHFGISTEFKGNEMILSKTQSELNHEIILDLNKTPDIAQTIAVCCAALKRKFILKGLETLKIKETDRLVALKNELIKIGAFTEITNDSINLMEFVEPKNLPIINTYKDHRMAMSFAPYALINPIKIEDSEVVKKSYLNFWNHLREIGFTIDQL